ncbi:MAG: allantoate amidohydrolase [Candidatus Gottesmanbacteria bacterium GW2011_GWA2_43_14]|uniref:Allantoate amidohydrolase n=1 Tax=Candidatus Gottesmanbacteria bacterium GW2011_GWA2_43_14 TaxID=1618443 RepID=A0A0G1DAW0_9BACT|nr:MAG: allantoate amidohydrolase [Candidatus Gottesmanbacteria bacterium GW2011_GWA2_43_14]
MLEQRKVTEAIIRQTIENINPHNLQSNIYRLAIISGGQPFMDGALKGRSGCYEVSALTLSDQEIRARKEVGAIFQENGIPKKDIYEHPMAVFGMLRSKNPGAPTLVIGSHTDTVQKGGAFDGRAGISMMLEMLRVLKEQGIELNINILFTAFSGEESAAFGTAFLGSRALVGEITDDILDQGPPGGKTFRQVLKERGIKPDDLKTPFLTETNFGSIIGFVEGHIEQADGMRIDGVSLQVNEAIAGANRQKVVLETNLTQKKDFKNVGFLKVTAQGRANHSGSTMMNNPDRKDGLVIMSYLLENLEPLQKILTEQGLNVKLTASSIKIDGQAMSKIPGRTEIILGVDGDDPDQVEHALKQLDQLVKEQNERLQGINHKEGIFLVAESLQDQVSVPIYESTGILSAYSDVSKIIRKVKQTFFGLAKENAVGTVTTFDIKDGKTILQIDMRGVSEKRDEGVEEVIEEIEKISAQSKIESKIDQVPGSSNPVVLDHEFADQFIEVAKQYGLGQAKRSYSPAGHDAGVIAASKNITNSRKPIPTALFFIPSEGGSHNPSEYTSPEDMKIGCQALTAFVMETSSKY